MDGAFLPFILSERMLKPPAYKKMPMLISTVVTSVAVFVATSLLFKILIDRIYFKIFS